MQRASTSMWSRVGIMIDTSGLPGSDCLHVIRAGQQAVADRARNPLPGKVLADGSFACFVGVGLPGPLESEAGCRRQWYRTCGM